MTLRTNARIAGFTFLFYIVVGIAHMVLYGKATGGADAAARLASIAQHDLQVRISILLGMLENFSALVLAVTLYGITRDVDRDLAILGTCFRVAEGILGAMASSKALVLMWLATPGTTAGAPDPAMAAAIAGTIFQVAPPGAIFFAVGSLLFAWLLLRGRMIPRPLAWIGVIASVLGVIGLPLNYAGFLSDSLTWGIWLPLLVYELPLGLWLLIKGVRAPAMA